MTSQSSFEFSAAVGVQKNEYVKLHDEKIESEK